MKTLITLIFAAGLSHMAFADDLKIKTVDGQIVTATRTEVMKALVGQKKTAPFIYEVTLEKDGTAILKIEGAQIGNKIYPLSRNQDATVICSLAGFSQGIGRSIRGSIVNTFGIGNGERAIVNTDSTVNTVGRDGGDSSAFTHEVLCR